MRCVANRNWRALTTTVLCVLSFVSCGDNALAATAAKPTVDPLEAARAAIRTKQFERAVGELRQQADRGSIDAQYLLGLALLNGLSQQPDREQGCRWLRTAAERGQAEAQFVLASILFTGGKSDAAEANLWLERAARGGNAAAQRAIQEKRPPLAAERKSVLADAKLRGALLLWAAKHDDAALTRALAGGAGVREAPTISARPHSARPRPGVRWIRSGYCWRRGPRWTLPITMGRRR